jgi:HSP20 family molecular chaperone IbpA
MEYKTGALAMTIPVQSNEAALTQNTEPAASYVEYAPAVDILERPDSFAVLADVPGTDEKEMEIGLENDTFTIAARTAHDEPRDMELLHRGYEPCSYRRVFKLPAGVERTKISASLKHGVLQIVLPKIAKAQPQKINVQVEK